MLDGEAMSVSCARCGQTAEPPPATRLGHMGPARERILGSVCGACWKEWEGVEVKVINEYRLSFLDPEHRSVLQRACLEFLRLE
jgi:Fe-S cluster biosynthesis and repair protein YggX